MNDFSTGGGGGAVGGPTEAPVSIPDTQPASPPVSLDEAIDVGRHTALTQLAKSEDVSEYAQERADEAAVIDRGEEIPQERQNKWFRRASKALADATAEAQGIQPTNEQQQQPQQYSDQSQYQGDPTQDPTYMRKQGIVSERISRYFGDNQELNQSIVDWGAAMDEQGTVADWLIQNESSVAPQILHRLSQHPEGWAQLVSLPPQTRDRWLAKLEGHIEAEMKFTQQQAQQQQQWAQQAARRTTKAPPPISKMPSGGARPPSDLHTLASRSEDISAYANQRRQQERKERS